MKLSRWLLVCCMTLFCWAASAASNTQKAHTVTIKQVPNLSFSYISHLQLKSHARSKNSAGHLKKQRQPQKLLSALKYAHVYPPLLFSDNSLPHSGIAKPEKVFYRIRASKVRTPPSLTTCSSWNFHPPRYAHRLGGWKESNTLYTGNLTFHT